MASSVETGHAKNVDNLGDLIAGVTSFGVKYNPSNPLLALTALKTKETVARASINAVNTAAIQLANASNERENAFQPLNVLVTRAVNTLRSSQSADNTDAIIVAIARKIHGARAASSKAAAKKAAAANPEVKIETVSVSQHSYDSQVDNLDRFVESLAAIPEYNPNEEELKVATLKTVAVEFRKLNNLCNTASYALDSARAIRNTELYAPNTGLVDVALGVKSYVKALFGATSEEYKRIAKVEFRNTKF